MNPVYASGQGDVVFSFVISFRKVHLYPYVLCSTGLVKEQGTEKGKGGVCGVWVLWVGFSVVFFSYCSFSIPLFLILLHFGRGLVWHGATGA